MKKTLFDLQIFAEENVTMAADMEPAISIDHASRFARNIKELQKVLGITEMVSMPAGNNIRIYKLEQVNTPDQVGEGEVIGLTKFRRTLARTVELGFKKFRKETTIEDIQKVGRDKAINDTDEKLIASIQKDIKNRFFASFASGTGKASGTNLQGVLAAIWGKLQKVYEDVDVTPIYMVSSDDVAEYLGTAQVTLQTAFGFSYIENFLGLGTVIVSPALAKGTVYGTAKENIYGAYAPASSGDVGATVGLTTDSTGLIGSKHYIDNTTANPGTLILSAVEFYLELLDGVIVGTISGTGA